jgi:hypothetical protein
MIRRPNSAGVYMPVIVTTFILILLGHNFLTLSPSPNHWLLVYFPRFIEPHATVGMVEMFALDALSIDNRYAGLMRTYCNQYQVLQIGALEPVSEMTNLCTILISIRLYNTKSKPHITILIPCRTFSCYYRCMIQSPTFCSWCWRLIPPEGLVESVLRKMFISCPCSLSETLLNPDVLMISFNSNLQINYIMKNFIIFTPNCSCFLKTKLPLRRELCRIRDEAPKLVPTVWKCAAWSGLSHTSLDG